MGLKWNEATREELADILERVAREGVSQPRGLDVALDTILSTIEQDPDVMLMQRSLIDDEP